MASHSQAKYLAEPSKRATRNFRVADSWKSRPRARNSKTHNETKKQNHRPVQDLHGNCGMQVSRSTIASILLSAIIFKISIWLWAWNLANRKQIHVLAFYHMGSKLTDSLFPCCFRINNFWIYSSILKLIFWACNLAIGNSSRCWTYILLSYGLKI